MSADTLLQDKLAEERRANFAAQAASINQNIERTKGLDEAIREP